MVDEDRRPRAAEQARQRDLPTRGGQQVHSAYDEIDAVLHVIHRDCELIRPLSVSIARQQISALRGRPLHLRPQPAVVESLVALVEPDANPSISTGAEFSIPAMPRIAQLA